MKSTHIILIGGIIANIDLSLMTTGDIRLGTFLTGTGVTTIIAGILQYLE